MNIELQIIYLAVFLLLILLLSHLVNFFLLRSFIGRYFHLFVAPGVVIHELSHAIACLATGAHIRRISFWQEDGGYVIHSPSRLPILGQVIISLAPIGGGLAAIFYLVNLWHPQILEIIKSIEISSDLLKLNFWQELGRAIGDYKLQNLYQYLSLYFLIAIAATLSPSKTDFKYALVSLFVISLLIILVAPLLLRLSWLNPYIIKVNQVFLFSLIVLFLILSVSILFWLISKIFLRR